MKKTVKTESEIRENIAKLKKEARERCKKETKKLAKSLGYIIEFSKDNIVQAFRKSDKRIFFKSYQLFWAYKVFGIFKQATLNNVDWEFDEEWTEHLIDCPIVFRDVKDNVILETTVGLIWDDNGGFNLQFVEGFLKGYEIGRK
jgi:mRNA-degrading endonuclease RelE of RelBE toxin-antitoxin system